MYKFVMYKVHNYDWLFGGYNWSLTPVEDGNMISSTPWEVEVPDDFSLGETVGAGTMFFRDGCDTAYELTIGRNTENGSPYLVNGEEMVKLNVVRELSWREVAAQ